MVEIQSFIDKNTFKNLAGCILIVEACTECVKYLIPISSCGLWVSFMFSVLTAFVRFLFNNDYSRDAMILSAINIVPIFLGAVGVYQVGIKPLENLLLSKEIII